jgi:hypothetical protein
MATLRTLTGPLIGSSLVWLFAGAAANAQITAAECDKLRAESTTLISRGVPKLMEKGPEWAKANLDQTKLADIKRMIEVSEQLTFRCETLKPINTKVEQVDGEGTDDDGTTPAATGAPAKPAAPSGEPVPAAKQPTPAPKPKKAAAVDQPAPKAKAAANDAFTPAAGASSTLNAQRPQ